MNNDKINIYQVLVRLFGAQKNTKYTSGKFNNFTDSSLQKIKDLGITHIWYTGIIDHATQTDYSSINKPADSKDIVKGEAGSPYAIRDYYDVAPDFSKDLENRMSEFEQLISRTHKNGLRAIIDFIPNHVARSYKSQLKPKYVKDFGEDDDSSNFFSVDNDFYYFPDKELLLPNNNYQTYKEYPAKATGNDSFTSNPSHTDWFETVKLNYGIAYHHDENVETPKTPNSIWFKMKSILEFWITKGIDGFRCDMAEMVPVSFWQWVIPEIKKNYPQIIFIAEVYDSRKIQNYLGKNGFDYLYDKTGFYDISREVLLDDLPVTHLAKYLQESQAFDNKLLRFLENHDEVRIASKYFLDKAEYAIPLLTTSMFAHKGPSMIYFGQELGETAEEATGFGGNDGRTSIFDYTTLKYLGEEVKDNLYDAIPNNKVVELLEQYKKTLNFALNTKVLRHGNFFDLTNFNDTNPHYNSKKVLSFIRNYKDEKLLFIINFHFKASQVVKILFPPHLIKELFESNSNFIKGEEIFNKAQKSWKMEMSQFHTNGVQISLWANSSYIFKLTSY